MIPCNELAESIKKKATLDWTQRETVRADMRRTVRRLLAKYGYPPDAQETATQLVIKQAELMAIGRFEMEAKRMNKTVYKKN